MSDENEEFNTMQRMSQRWGGELTQQTLREKVSFENSLQMLINRIMICNPEEYETLVMRLLNAVPVPWIDDEFEEELKKASKESKTYQFKIWCGQNLGTIEKPLLDDDGNVLSPIAIEEVVTDYDVVFNSILNLFNRRGILLKQSYSEFASGSFEKGKPTSMYICTNCDAEFHDLNEAKKHEGICDHDT